jgi:iron transport multicopper oxidase
VNGFTFVDPSVPVLLQILSSTQNASDLIPKGSIYGLGANRSVEITIPGDPPGGPVSVRATRGRAIVTVTML